MNGLAKVLILSGSVLVLVGAILLLAGKFPGFKSMPGDIVVKKENFTFYFPLGTSILISLVLTFLFFLWRKLGA